MGIKRIDKGVNFKSLPQNIRNLADRSTLLVQAQKRFIQSRAPIISNEAYWQKIVAKFETDKLDDHTLDASIYAFLKNIVNPEKSIIEFGCGIGRTANVLKNKGYRNYLGIDVAMKAVVMAKNRLTDMEFRVGNVLTFTSSRKYDAAIATDVLLYLSPEDQINALINIGKCLKRGAPLIIRWAPAEEGVENDVLIKEKVINDENVEGWVFLATEDYVEELLKISGFSLTKPIIKEEVIINPGTPYEKPQDYLVIFAEKR